MSIKLHQGDCMEALREMEDNQFDLVIVFAVDTVSTTEYSSH